jgi:hypothetical protein
MRLEEGGFDLQRAINFEWLKTTVRSSYPKSHCQKSFCAIIAFGRIFLSYTFTIMVKCLFTLTLFALGVGTANAWATISVKNIQKAAAAGVMAAALLGAAPLVSHATSPFDGSYSGEYILQGSKVKYIVFLSR